MYNKTICLKHKEKPLDIIDCIKTRSAVFQLYSKNNADVNATVIFQGSIDKKHWYDFGELTINPSIKSDAGNASFMWLYIRAYVVRIDGDAVVSVVTRV